MFRTLDSCWETAPQRWHTKERPQSAFCRAYMKWLRIHVRKAKSTKVKGVIKL